MPEAVYVAPLHDHVYVSQPEATDVFDVLLLMVRFNVKTESHPDADTYVVEYKPLVVYVLPFQVYVSQAEALIVPLSKDGSAIVNTVDPLQPFASVAVKVYVPAV